MGGGAVAHWRIVVAFGLGVGVGGVTWGVLLDDRGDAAAGAPERPVASKGRSLTPPAFAERPATESVAADLEGAPAVTAEPAPVAEGEGGVPPSSPEVVTIDCSTSISEECPVLSPPPKVLLERARCGTVATDVPRFLQTDDLDEELDPHGVTSPEEMARAQVRTAFRAQVREQLDYLYREIAGPRYRPTPGLTKMRSRIEALVPEGANRPLFKRIADERAGLLPPPTPDQIASLPAGERFWRLWLNLGDGYEETLARAIGRDRARALRQERAGWSSKATFGGPCPD